MLRYGNGGIMGKEMALAGKTAIVTGASSGIGYATAAKLAASRAAVVIHARREERLEKLVAEISSKGGKAIAVVGDAGIPADIDLLLEKTLAWKEGGESMTSSSSMPAVVWPAESSAATNRSGRMCTESTCSAQFV